MPGSVLTLSLLLLSWKSKDTDLVTSQILVEPSPC